MKKYISILTLIFCLFGSSLFARHIVGGAITYECLGNGDYEFTMKIYRDCNCDRCADLDDEAPIAIFRCGGGGISCNGLEQGDQIYDFEVPLNPQINSIPNPDYPCLIPPDICVEEGVYNWKLSDYGISLPSVDESYYIVYQRCCRNVTINNLNSPGDQGATFLAEITPASQKVCNNSADFNYFPPTIICAGEPLVFDHSATDIDNDQIVYEFCSPLNGGGRGGGGAAGSCNSPSPDPACPPPYDNVIFQIPTYSAQNPMGGNPIVRIDPNTGLITGTPTVQGQFVVGVCATEYRNGLPIGRTIRDFQFNVGDCAPLIVGTLNAPLINDTFFVDTCGSEIIKLKNISFQERFIDDFFWQFDVNGRSVRSNEWDPTINFEQPGVYYGNLFLNPGTTCGDTADVQVSVYPQLTVDFDYAYDTCVAGPVQFTNLSNVDGATFAETTWRLGDGTTSNEESLLHSYSEPGNLLVRLNVEDSNGCKDDVVKVVNWFPAPNVIVVSPSAEEGCVPYEVFFSNLSSPVDDTYDIEWEFGDGETGNDISPTHTYRKAGLFDVAVTITSPIGCTTDTVFEELIFIDGSPIADFTYTPDVLNSFTRTAEFTDQSIRTKRHIWTFDDEFTTLEVDPTYTFRDTGVHTVRLIAVHKTGCRDTLEINLDVVPEVTFFLPNAFTPNNDTKNDFFKGVGFTEGMRSFEMKIWNRWGETIFETKDPNEGWNGLKNNVGKPVPNGVYVVVVHYQDPRGNPVEITGVATVIR